jgi:adhesin HecA-like repeat protein
MASESQNPKSGLAIQANEKNGHLSGTGTVTVSGDKDSVMAAFTTQDNGKTQVTLGFKDDVTIVAGSDLSFEGHADLDPRTGKLSAGTSMTYSVDKDEAIKLQAQFGSGGPSGQVSVNINF